MVRTNAYSGRASLQENVGSYDWIDFYKRPQKSCK